MTSQFAPIDAPSQHRRLNERQQEFLLLLVVVSLAAVVRWLFLSGPAGSDDTRYMEAAVALASGEPPARLDHANVRASFLIWLSAWSWLGLTASQLVFSQIAASAIQAAALFWVARMLTDARSAFIAAALWVFFPVELVFGGVLTPDQVSVAFALFSLGFFIRGLRDHSSPNLRDALLAGLTGALAYSAKEPFFLLAPLFAAWSVAKIGVGRRAWRWHGSLALGFLIVVVLEHVFYAAWTGDWLYKYRALMGAYGSGGGGQLSAAVAELTYYPRRVLANFATSGFFGWLLLVGALASGAKLRHWKLVLAWSIAFFVFLQFGSTSMREYTPFPMQARYVGPVVVLLFIPLGLTVLRLATESPLRTIGTLILFFAFVSHGIMVARQRIARGLYNSSVPATAAALIDAPVLQNRNVFVPANFLPYLPVDLRSATTEWQVIKIREWAADPSALREFCPCAILVPERPTAGDMRQQLEEAGLEGRALEVAITPLDALLDNSAFRFMNVRTSKRVVGHVYLHPPQPPEAPIP